MPKYAIYLRKSRSDNVEDSIEETLSRHEELLLSVAKNMKLSVAKIFREVVSGESLSNRPEMQCLLKEVEEGLYDGVLVVEIERLARGNSIDQGIIAQCFQYSNTKIITPNKIIDPNDDSDSEALEFGLFMSRREYKVINRRLQRGRVASVKEGKFVGNTPPYGYERIKLEKGKGFTLVPLPDQAEIVRMIFDLYTSGEEHGEHSQRLGVALIARRLNSLNIPSPTGREWSGSTIRDIIINPVYIGKIRWNWRPIVKKMVDGQVVKERPRSNREDCLLIDGLHVGIVDPSVFKQAQRSMSNNQPHPVSERYKIKNPLAGIVVCGKCGKKMVRRPYRNYPDTLMCAAPTCDNVSSHLHLVEERILESLEDWLSDYKLRWNLKPPAKSSSLIATKKRITKETENEIETLKKQRNTAHDLLEQEVYDSDTFLSRIKAIDERLKKAQEEFISLEAELKLEENRAERRQNMIPKVEHLLEVYRQLSNAKEKNELLKEIVEKVVYVKEVGGRWNGEVDGFKLELYPKLPSTTKTTDNILVPKN